MHRIDKANLRLAVGMGLAVLIAYGAALPVPFAVCVMVVIFLCKPGPPLPLAKANGAKIHQPEKIRNSVSSPAATQRTMAMMERTVQAISATSRS